LNVLSLFRRRPPTINKQTALRPVDNSWRGGWFRVLESYSGAWQQNVVLDRDTVLTYSAVYACITLIAQDIGKLRIKLVEQQPSGIWKEIHNPAYSPVLRKPNRYQTRVKFIEHWVSSKLIHGNAYALKQRDDRNIVVALYLLDPTRVTVLVSDDGSVFYRLKSDNLGRLPAEVTVPAREIIHDPMVPLFHPLCGVSPLTACGLAALQGLRIQNNSAVFFGNSSNPGGIITAPGAISDEAAAQLREQWNTSYTGANAGKVAVLGDGLKFEQMAVNATDAQLIEQLKWTAETVASCFHIPPYMIGIGPMPTYNNIEALNQQYYNQCLQSLLENLELSLDEGLDMVSAHLSLGTEFDLKGLLRMDTATRYKAHSDAIGGGWLAPNEARLDEDLPPAEGGDSPMMQQQQFSLEALAERDQDQPFAKPLPAAPARPALPPPEQEPANEEARQAAYVTMIRGYLNSATRHA
jgi:HK97 family phage portal protein